MMRIRLWPRLWRWFVFLCLLFVSMVVASPGRAIEYEGDPSTDDTGLMNYWDPYYWPTPDEYEEWFEMIYYGDPAWEWEEDMTPDEYEDLYPIVFELP